MFNNYGCQRYIILMLFNVSINISPNSLKRIAVVCDFGVGLGCFSSFCFNILCSDIFG